MARARARTHRRTDERAETPRDGVRGTERTDRRGPARTWKELMVVRMLIVLLVGLGGTSAANTTGGCTVTLNAAKTAQW